MITMYARQVEIINRINIANAFFDRLSITVYMDNMIFKDNMISVLSDQGSNRFMTLDSVTCF